MLMPSNRTFERIKIIRFTVRDRPVLRANCIFTVLRNSRIFRIFVYYCVGVSAGPNTGLPAAAGP